MEMEFKLGRRKFMLGVGKNAQEHVAQKLDEAFAKAKEEASDLQERRVGKGKFFQVSWLQKPHNTTK